MNRITVTRLLYIQCEEKRLHATDLEEQRRIFERKRKEKQSALNFNKTQISCDSFHIPIFFIYQARFFPSSTSGKILL